MVQRKGLRAGEPVRALDTPSYEYAASSSTQSDLANTPPDWVAMDEEVAIHFIAPSSGRGIMCVAGRLRDNSATGGEDRPVITYEVRLGSRNGSRHVFPNFLENAWTGSTFITGNYQAGCRLSPVENLIPGQTYFAQVLIASSIGAGTADIGGARIFFMPCG